MSSLPVSQMGSTATTPCNIITASVASVTASCCSGPAFLFEQSEPEERYTRLEIQTCIPLESNLLNYTSPTQWKNINESTLDFLLTSREGFVQVTKLQDVNAVAVANSIDEMLQSGRLVDHQQRKYTAVLRKLCGNRGILPDSHMITDALNKVGKLPVARGGFAEVWEGTHRSQRVAIKVLRIYSSSDQAKVKRRFWKEAVIWRRLSHPNVLPFIGVSISPSKFRMVSPWMVNGEVIVYLKSHPQANPIRILKDIIDGLGYLHSMNVVHGDLKGPNILMNENEQACLADFGLATVICHDTIPGYSMTTANCGTARWMGPELILPEQFGLTKCIVSKASDIYAFGMVIYEVITRTVPFRQYGNSAAVMQRVIAGVRPERPSDAASANLVDAVWSLAEECWRQNWDERPLTCQVSERLHWTLSRWIQPESISVVPNLEIEFDNHSEGSSDSDTKL